MLIAFDLDGTLADLTHRLCFIRDLPEGKKPDWDRFFKYTPFDIPIPEMIQIHNDLFTMDNQIIYTSGRSDITATDTVTWLRKHTKNQGLQLDPNVLFMRSKNDRRADYLVKKDMLTKIIDIYGQKPDLVFDDRSQVVNMWRAEGIRCCQVADGNF